MRAFRAPAQGGRGHVLPPGLDLPESSHHLCQGPQPKVPSPPLCRWLQLLLSLTRMSLHLIFQRHLETDPHPAVLLPPPGLPPSCPTPQAVLPGLLKPAPATGYCQCPGGQTQLLSWAGNVLITKTARIKNALELISQCAEELRINEKF